MTEKKVILIGLSGKAGVGKSAIAAALVVHGFTVVSFADVLRTEVSEEYQIPIEALKHAKDQLWRGLHFPMPCPEMSLREILQSWGAYRRNQDPNYIIDKTFAHLASIGDRVVIDDVRLKSEANRIRDTPGSFLVRIDPHACWDASRSSDDITETDLDEYGEFDLYYRPTIGSDGIRQAAVDIVDMAQSYCNGSCALS